MYTFVGDYESRADQKNRVVLPSAFKREFGDGGEEGVVRVVVKKDIFENCLLVYPRSVWEGIMSDLRSRIDPYNRKHGQFLREFQRNTSEANLDASGRLLIPQRLMSSVGIDKDMTMLGVGDHIELWDTVAYSSGNLDADQLGELADEVFADRKRV